MKTGVSARKTAWVRCLLAQAVWLAAGCGMLRPARDTGLPPLPISDRELARLREDIRSRPSPGEAPTPAARYRGIAMVPLAQVQSVGGSPIQIANVPQLSPTPGTNFVVSLWVRCDRPPTAQQGYAAVIGKYSESMPASSRWLIGIDTTLHPFLKTSTTGTAVTASRALQAGTWHLLVAEWASNGMARLYVDTNLCASGTLSLLPSSDLPVTVGDTYPLGGAHALDGGVDEVRISRRPATIEAVAAIFASAPDNDQDGVMDGNDPDDNNDGLPDEWAALYFGDRLAGAPGDDPDGDGISNWNEYISGTNPSDGQSVFAVWDVSGTATGRTLTVECDGLANRFYTVWFASNLVGDAHWVPAGEPQTCSATGPLRLTVPAPADAKGYFRVSVRIVP